MSFVNQHLNFPEGWNVQPFNEAIIDATSGNPKVKQSDYRIEGKYPVIDQGQKFISGYVDNDDLLCKEILPVILFGDHTKIFKFVEKPFVLGADGVKVLVPKGEWNTRYLFYYLKTLRLPENVGYSRHFKYLKEARIPRPSLPEQNRIAEILDKTNKILDKRQKAIQLTNELSRSVFLDMFGDPVTNPKGWKETTFGDEFDVRDGTHDSPSYVDEGYPLVTSKNIKEGDIDLDNVRYISKEDYDAINKRSKVDIGDVLMPMIGTIGNPVVIRREPNFAIKNVALIKLGKSYLTPEFISLLLSGPLLNQAITEKGRGGTQKFLSLGDIRALKLYLPNKELVMKYGDIVKRLNRNMIRMRESLSCGLFESLSKKAFSGKL